MCGRYHFLYTPEMQALFDALGLDAALGDRPNLAPTDEVPIIVQSGGKPECHLARWWLTPRWSRGPDTRYSMFNARAENLESSRAFKGPFHHTRCVVPASAFIEWQVSDGGKQPMELQRADDAPLLLAGVWDSWNDELLSCAIITCEAHGDMRSIHPRMPVMLEQSEIAQWLDTATEISTLLDRLQHPAHFELKATPVDRAINNAASKTTGTAIGKSFILSSDSNDQP